MILQSSSPLTAEKFNARFLRRRNRITHRSQFDNCQQWIAIVELDLSYNCHCVLRLNSGREVVLDRLSQSRVYAGLLEGTPHRALTDHFIQRALERARKEDASLGEPYLVAPGRRDYFRTPGDMQYFFDRQADRAAEIQYFPEWLPQIGCIGVFRSLRPSRDTTKDCSSLVIV